MWYFVVRTQFLDLKQVKGLKSDKLFDFCALFYQKVVNLRSNFINFRLLLIFY